jgi:hypothetical protein
MEVFILGQVSQNKMIQMEPLFIVWAELGVFLSKFACFINRNFICFLRGLTMDQADLEFVILLPQFPKCWDYRHASSHLARLSSCDKQRLREAK